MNKTLAYLVSLILILSVAIISCDDNISKDVSNNNSAISSVNDEIRLSDFLSLIDLDMAHLDLYTPEQLFSKYELVAGEYSDHKYSKAARYLIVANIVERGMYEDGKIIFLLSELEKFDTPYPRQSFLLLEQAKYRNALTANQINLFGEKAYNKALARSPIWEAFINKLPPPSEDVSVDAERYRKMLDKLAYTEKLKIYSPISK